ncbi:MAG: hypothetical protein KDD33_06540 [Bdellovibrionales bacterium]|nr:hypothetical protein [Bdellovibrionales bacterium]
MYQKSRDLILISLFGMIYYAVAVAMTGHLNKIPAVEFFAIPFVVAILLGFIIQASHQIIEWPLCYLFGGAVGSVLMVGVLSYLGVEFNLMQFSQVISHTFAWFGILAGIMLVGILVGYFLRLTVNLILGSLKVLN